MRFASKWKSVSADRCRPPLFETQDHSCAPRPECETQFGLQLSILEPDLFVRLKTAHVCEFMRILIAEDDEALARFVRQGSGRRALFSRYFAEPARIAATEVDYDVVVHGLNLSKLDGVSVLRHVSSEKPSLPVLVLKQRRRVKDRLPCPDTGADDCLAKPFSFSELSAHSRALGSAQPPGF